MAYSSIQMNEELHVDEIYTVHYFEYMKDFSFPGERHDFWEFQCVDKGEAEVCTDRDRHLLSRGQIIFHRPNEFHSLRSTGKTALNMVVVSFSCHSPSILFFENRILDITAADRNLMGMLIAEARCCILTPLDDPRTEQMVTRADSPFGSQQLVRLYLEQLLIQMYRRYSLPQSSLPTDSSHQKKCSEICQKIILYLEERIRESVTIEEICHDNLIGRSQLQKIFREQQHCGVIEYFCRMKIELARQLMRENRMNFTQISDYLGYSSIHYFSRQFKKISGMTPSEYASSIKAISEHKKDTPLIPRSKPRE